MSKIKEIEALGFREVREVPGRGLCGGKLGIACVVRRAFLFGI